MTWTCPVAPMRLVLLAAVLAAGAGAGGRVAAETKTVARSLEVDGRTRTYHLHVPARLGTAPAPLVLVFHGGGGTGRRMERMTRLSEIADREGFLVVYPDGVAEGWNDGRDRSAQRTHREGVDDVAFVVAMLDAIARDHPVDPRRVFATGASNGAMFSHYLAALRSDRIAAIAPVVGGLADPFHRAFAPRHPVSVLIIQGTEDPLVPYDGGLIAGGGRGRIVSTDEAVRHWVAHNAATGPTAAALPDGDPADGCRGERLSWTGGRGGTEVMLIRLVGGGHTWPGGPQYLAPGIIGRVCRDFHASELIWAFFKAHPHP